MLRFDVLDAEVPPILGMTFLAQVNPVIDWQRSWMRVKCGSRTQLVKCSVFSRQSVVYNKTEAFGDVASSDDVATQGQHHVGMDVAKTCANEFAGLPVGVDLQGGKVVA